MTGPEISPLLGRLGGESFRSDLKKRLEELANETDDDAYASRLRLVARGDRPLRTLMHDPSWIKQFEHSFDLSSIPDEVAQEDREVFDERVAALRNALPDAVVSPEQAAIDATEIASMADRAQAITAQEHLAGWNYVHEIDQDKNGSQSSDDER